jgi:hypothetical protein
MDIKGYQNERDKELRTFKAEIADLKGQYTLLLSEVIQDDSRLQELLDVNQHLSDRMHQFISESGTKFDKSVIQDLTNKIMEYQTEYTKLKKTKKASEEANAILHKESLQLNETEYRFNIFLGILFLCIVFLIYLIFTVPSQSVLRSPILPTDTMI